MHFSITLNYAYQHNIRFYQIYSSDNIMIYHDISRYIMIYCCFGWSQWRMSLSHWFLSNKTPHRLTTQLWTGLSNHDTPQLYDVFYWTKIVWNWLQHRVIMINHDISWYITKYQIISDNIRQYQTISWYITIYHDLSWYIMIYQELSSEFWTLKIDIELRKWHKSAITSRFIMIWSDNIW